MILDLIAALVISLGFYFGYRRGFIKTIFDTASFIVGIIAALILSPYVIAFIQSSFNIAQSIAYILGIVITFILVMILVRFIGKKVEDVFKAVNLNFLNKFNGGALQALFFAILLSYGVALMNNVDLIKEDTKQKSISYPYLVMMPGMSQKLFEGLKPVFKGFWDATMDAMNSVKGEVDSIQNSDE
jgi:membrane protein required for colicin V production